ncbi:hypothetical protein GUITHDRAFT_57272, partial [Guillardia theta CCMP2712]
PRDSHSSTSEDKECMICLSGFRTGERIRMLPCLHTFHKLCIDEWLQTHEQCPLCMQNV